MYPSLVNCAGIILISKVLPFSSTMDVSFHFGISDLYFCNFIFRTSSHDFIIDSDFQKKLCIISDFFIKPNLHSFSILMIEIVRK